MLIDWSLWWIMMMIDWLIDWWIAIEKAYQTLAREAQWMQLIATIQTTTTITITTTMMMTMRTTTSMIPIAGLMFVFQKYSLWNWKYRSLLFNISDGGVAPVSHRRLLAPKQVYNTNNTQIYILRFANCFILTSHRRWRLSTLRYWVPSRRHIAVSSWWRSLHYSITYDNSSCSVVYECCCFWFLIIYHWWYISI